MATLFGLTSYTEVIIQLGIDKEELLETEFNSSGIQGELQLDLLQWFPLYQTLSDSTDTASNVVAQKLALKIYCKVFCAETMAIISPMRFVQQSGDGDNASKRFQNSNSLNEFRDSLAEKKAEMKAIVLSYTTAFSPEETSVVVTTQFMSSAAPAVDKITGL